MFLTFERLLKADNDKDFYKVFFIVIGFLNILFHFLYVDYAPQSWDPFALRIIISSLCLLTFIVSYIDNTVYKAIAYLTLIAFVGYNNCYVLGANNFSGEYFLGSLICILLVSFLCWRLYELAVLMLVNLLAFACAFAFTTTKSNTDVVPFMSGCVILFSGLACLLFLMRRSYIMRYIRIKGELQDQKEIGGKNEVILDRNVSLLQSITAGNINLIFEFDSKQICTHVWCPADDALANDAENMIGRPLHDFNIPSLGNLVKSAIKNHKAINFEFQSLFQNDRFYTALVAPVFSEDLRFTGNITLTINDITDFKLVTSTLKENELVLFNEQIVAKIGSWWTDISGKDISWSNNLFSILEVTDIPPERTKLGYYISLIHPEDKEGAQHYFTSLADNPLIAFEHRLITPKGNLKYFKIVSGYPVKNENGKVLKVAGIIQDVTESKIANKIIKKNQAELMQVQSMAKIGGWKWDVLLNDLSWSEEIYNIYELEKDEVKHEDHFKLLLSFVHPDDRANVSLIFKDPLRILQSFIEFRIITAAGNVKYLSLIVGRTVQKDGVVKSIIGTLQDQTDRKKIEFDFERSENKYKNVLENINLAAVTLNRKGDIVFCNKHLADLVGYDKIEMIGMNWIDSFVPDNLKDQFSSWLNSSSFYSQHTTPVICRNGKQRTINWKNTVVHDEFGKIIETTSIGEDITDVKKAREALIIAKENAEKSSRFKSEFLSIMSHEIRTPMNAVIGTTNLLLQDDPAPRQLEYLNTLRYSSNNLLELINDILDYNKIEAGKLELYKTPFNIHKLVQNILQAFKTKAEDNGSFIQLNLDPRIPANLIGDQLRLGQVLNNLISNAVKFTHQGTVSLNLTVEQEAPKKVNIKFSIADTGIGISPENMEKIFDPFTQEYHSTQSDYGGTGLGLAITKRLVELHNSTIKLVSAMGKGTEFTFAITFEKAEIADVEPVKEPIRTAVDTSLKGMSILLVDDNKMNLLIANKFLKNWQATVKQATDGQMAVELAMVNNYDLIIMDLQMPIMDGFEAAAIIKQTQPDLPIIALSADAMPETSLKAAQYGMDEYLTKPFVPEVLFEKIVKFYKPVGVDKW